MKKKDKEIIKIIKKNLELTFECEPGTIEISLPPKEVIQYKEHFFEQPNFYIFNDPHRKFSISGEMKSITLTKKTKKKSPKRHHNTSNQTKNQESDRKDKHKKIL